MLHNDKFKSEGVTALTRTEQTALAIRSLRNLFGMSQNELAKAAGVSRPTISRLEKLEGEKSIRSTTLDNLMRVFAEHGAEVHFLADNVRIELSKTALVFAANNIRSQAK
jgi:transcriptional regulator with XRE-family HTH domain|tara:strand:+ start:452 stop:781 length:330 start_codon:yes stop_codon:yes gene_type:complete